MNSNTDFEAVVMAVVARHASLKGSLLPILHDVQAELGHVPTTAVPIIAQLLNLSRADVHGVISFYHDLRSQPPSRPVVKLCRAEACQARGVAAVAPVLEADERIEVETVYCLGLCASGPSALSGDKLFARLDAVAARALADEVAA